MKFFIKSMAIVLLGISTNNAFSDSIFNSLSGNGRACKVGDLLTVIIKENTSLNHEGNTTLNKDQKLNASISSFLYPSATSPTDNTQTLINAMDTGASSTKSYYMGSAADKVLVRDPSKQNGWRYIGSRLGMLNGTMPLSGWTSSSNFNGSGAVSSSDTVNAYISVMVLDVLPNDVLIIEGTKEVEMDGEKRIITLSGMIRQADIKAYPESTALKSRNTILSSLIANAKISCTGTGAIGDQRKRGFLKKLWDWINPY